MSFYENKLKLVESSFKQLLDENKLIVETKSNLIKSVSDLRILFTTKFNQCICDLEIVINAAKEIEVKQENINDNEIEESPASIRPILIWPNDSKIWVHDKSLRKNTFTERELEKIKKEIEREVQEGHSFAKKSAYPLEGEVTKYVFK